MEVYATIFTILVSCVLFSSTTPFLPKQKLERVRRIPILHFHNEDSDKVIMPREAVGHVTPISETYKFLAETISEQSGDSSDREALYERNSSFKKNSESAKSGNHSLDSVRKNEHNRRKPHHSDNKLHSTLRPKKDVSPWIKFCSKGMCSSSHKAIGSNKKTTTMFSPKTSLISSSVRKSKARPKRPPEERFVVTFNTPCTTTFPPTTLKTLLYFTREHKRSGRSDKLRSAGVDDASYDSRSESTPHPPHLRHCDLLETSSFSLEDCSWTANTGIINKDVGKGQDRLILFPEKRTHKGGGAIRSEEDVLSFAFNPNLVHMNENADKPRIKRSAAHIDFFPLGQPVRDQRPKNGTNKMPCPKSCSFNFTQLFNAHTIKPPDYYKQKGPALDLCCDCKEDSTTTKKVETLQDLWETTKEETTTVSSTTTEAPVSEMTSAPGEESSETPDVESIVPEFDGASDFKPPDSSSTVAATFIIENTTVTIGNEVTETSEDSISPSRGMVTAPLYKMLLQFVDMTTRRKHRPRSAKPKEQFVLKLLVKKKDDANASIRLRPIRESKWPLNQLRLSEEQDYTPERPFKVYVKEIRRTKKPKPWDKFCPNSNLCTDMTDVAQHPWVSTCCYELGPATSKLETGEEGPDERVVKTLSYHLHSNRVPNDTKNWQVNNASSEKLSSLMPAPMSHGPNNPYTPDVRYINAKKQDILNILKPENKDNLVVLVRVPLTVAQRYGKEGVINLLLPVNNTLLRKYVKPRSIFDQLIPSILKKTTPTKSHGPKPWEDPWKFQTSFNLFPSSPPVKEEGDDNFDLSKLITTRTEVVTEDDSKEDNTGVGQFVKKLAIGSENYKLYDDLIETTSSKNPWMEGCPEKCVTYVIKFPKEAPVINETRALLKNRKVQHTTAKSLVLLQKFGDPPKYFIEVPDTLGELIKKAADSGSGQYSFITHRQIKERKDLASGAAVPKKLLLKPLSHNKPIVLYLQSFEVNGHNVYLPFPNNLTLSKERSQHRSMNESTSMPVDDLEDYFESSEHMIKGKTPKHHKDMVDISDSPVPFALIPAYLTFHPRSPMSYDFNIYPRRSRLMNSDKGARNWSSIEMLSKAKDRPSKVGGENDTRRVDDEKWITLAKQIENSIQNPLPLAKHHSGPPSAATEVPAPAQSPPEEPSFVFLMKGTGQPSIVEIGVLPTADNKQSQGNREEFTPMDFKELVAEQMVVTRMPRLH